ncbi:MAG TPA: insulinase family protein, partial [Novosphingobium sp.]|nr:insulinase family protein [Novosphingobium sp.]
MDNGLRFVIRRNATPAGTALVRMEVAAGSLSESEDERGYAHFVEHMAFNGSTRVPEGEMVRLLEREGLAFGADTNAQTAFDRTTYLLDLPRAEDRLLDTALMLMRETASELTFSPEAVERERGVILAERRDRNTFALRNLESQIAFNHPQAHYTRRLPIGTAEALTAATAVSLRAFWEREYVPERTTVIVVGDFDPDLVEATITRHFASWTARPPAPAPAPLAGPVLPHDRGRTAIYLDPALSERVTASRNGAWLNEADTLAQREENVLRQIGYGVVNRRLQRLSRDEDPPFRAAGFGTGAVFREGRATNLVVDTVDGKWRRGLIAAALEYRRAMAEGFSEAEIAEQVANLRTSARNLAASAETRSHSALVSAVFALLREDLVPATPQSALDRLEGLIPRITPDSVLAALKREAVPLADPLLRFQGRRAPQGGERAIRRAWAEAMALPLPAAAAGSSESFAYVDFGPPGEVASDAVEPLLAIRQVRFANGVRLNLKRTELEKERIAVQLSLDGGDFLNTPDQPLTTAMVGNLPSGGLGRHSQDELQSLLAGRSVAANLASTPETFVATASTTPRDLELQLQLMAAMITDPGYRREGEVRYRQTINTLFEQLRATPQVALSNLLGGILSDNDPRFTLQPVESYRALTFSALRDALSERLAKGAIEIGIVGDIDEEEAIALVARTLGALPAREADF